MTAEVTSSVEGLDEFTAPHLRGLNQAPALVEERVVRWMAELMRLPAESSGILLGDGTMANILGLAVARYSGCGFDVRRYGLYGGTRRLTVYGSSESEGWAQKGLELLGLGRESWRRISTRDFRIDVTALRRQLAADRRGGLQPLCVIGTAGSVGTGTSDNLIELARVCSEEGVWFHVDGAFGALAQWSERLRPRVAGIEQADSVAFDLHEWAYQPFTIACLLVRRGEMHRNAFASAAPQLTGTRRKAAAGGLPFADLGVELTREFSALEVWMSLKAHGVRLITSVMELSVDLAAHLAGLVRAHPDLELLAPVDLNIVCFRFAPRDCASQSRLDALNEVLLRRLQDQGASMLSGIVIGGRFALRCAFANQRITSEDVASLAAEVTRTGSVLTHSDVARWSHS
jgi:aromatic-L-amino-acid decarboxylase